MTILSNIISQLVEMKYSILMLMHAAVAAFKIEHSWKVAMVLKRESLTVLLT